MRTSFYSLCVVIGLLVSTSMSLLVAQDRYVNPDGVCGGNTPCYTTIQAAINSAVAGDTILVSAGNFLENITINKNISLIGSGSNNCIIDGVSGGQLGTIDLTSGRNGVLIEGFHVKGINGTAGLEKAAIYLRGTQQNIIIRFNTIEARGDAAMIGEYNASNNGIEITDNHFTGKTFLGDNPAGVGFGSQFTLDNVPRQVLNFGGGAGTTNTQNFTFTNNIISTIAGGMSITDNSGNPISPTPQGNTLVTLDLVGTNTISGNTFSGTTTRFAEALRVRGSGSYTISGNNFNGSYPVNVSAATTVPAVGLSRIQSVWDNNTFSKGVLILDSNSDVKANVIPTIIQSGIDAAATGDILLLSSGEFDAKVDLNKPLTILGNGAQNTLITRGVDLVAPQAGNSRMVLKDLTVNTNLSPYIGDTRYAIRINAEAGNTAPVTLENVTAKVPSPSATVYGTGLFITPNGNTIDDVVLLNCNFSDSYTHGIYVKNSSGISGTVSNLDIENCTVNNNDSKGGTGFYGYGLYAGTGGTTPFSYRVNGLSIKNSTFNNHYRNGLYVENINNVSFEGVTVTGNGQDGLDINLKFDNYENFSFESCTFTGNSTIGSNRPDLHIKARNDGSYAPNPASLSNVTITESSIGYISFGNNFLTNPSVSETSLSVLVNYISVPDKVVQATHNYWGSATPAFQTIIVGSATYCPYYSDSGKTTLTCPPVYNVTQNKHYYTITSAINAASTVNGDVIEVASGTFAENVVINKSLDIRGANYNAVCGENRTSESVIAPASGLPLSITASGVTLNGFEITAPAYQNAIVCGNTSNLTLAYNNIHHINSSVTPALTVTHAIQYTVNNAPAATSNVQIIDNCFSFIGSSSLTGHSASAIGILQSTTTGTLTDLTIERNTIDEVTVSNATWPTGKIAYGIIINVGGSASYETSGKVVNARIKNNEISNLSGHIATGIALEGNSENAEVLNNIVSNLNGTKSANRAGGGYDISGLKFENNRYVGTVTVTGNAFNSNTYLNGEGEEAESLGYAVSNYVPTSVSGAADVSCNWLGYNAANILADNDDLDGKIFNKANCSTIFQPYLGIGDDSDEDEPGFQPPVGNQPGNVAAVTGNSQPINNGSTTYSATNLTLMGSAPIGGSITRNYTFTTGAACGGVNATTFSSLTFSGAGADRFSFGNVVVNNQYTGGTYNFTISYQAAEEALEDEVVCIMATESGTYTFGLKAVTIVPEAIPAIAEIRGNNVVIANGSFSPNSSNHTNFGTLATPGTLARTFTITNAAANGAEELTVGAISITGPQADKFTVSANTCNTPLASGQSCTFTVTYTSGNTGGVSNATIAVANSDAARNPYEFAIQAELLSPSISVRGNNATITNGSQDPIALNHTLMGSALQNQTITRTYTIKNLGLGGLDIGSNAVEIGVTGNGSGHTNFEVITQPAAGILATNQETFFSVRFTSPGQGQFFGLVTLTTQNAGNFTFVVQANGPSPRMQVTGNNIDIPSGSVTVSTADLTDYGTRALNSTLERTFSLKNPGSLGAAAPLNLTGSPRAVVSGPGAAMFAVTIQPAATVGVNGSSTWRIRYRPTSAGCHWAQISIASNDPARNPYTFVVRGNTAGQSCDPEYPAMGLPGNIEWIAIDADQELEELNVYPNPASQKVWIESPVRAEAYTLEIIQMDGRVIHTLSTTGGVELIGISHLTSGMYFVRSSDPTQQPVRFIKW